MMSVNNLLPKLHRSNKLSLIAIFLLSFVPLASFAGGLSAWTENTPYGHEMYHDGTAGGWITLTLDTTSVSFKHFYFYKNCTIASADSRYFIINEKLKTVQEFTKNQDWNKVLEAENLVPFMKREYGSNYSSAFGDGVFFLLILFPIPFLLPLLWLVCLISLAFANRRFWSFRKHYSWLYPAICLAFLIWNTNPQSI